MTNLTCTGLSPSTAMFSKHLLLPFVNFLSVLQPQSESGLVWAPPLSLATTYGIIIIFSSSMYLDVSVPLVIST